MKNLNNTSNTMKSYSLCRFPRKFSFRGSVSFFILCLIQHFLHPDFELDIHTQQRKDGSLICFILIAILLATGLSGSRAQDTWTQKADFGGSGRYGAVGFSIAGKGYIGTGWDAAAKNDFWEYDPATNAWTQKANFEGGVRFVATGFSIDSKGYIGTGWDGASTFYNDFWEYDPVTNAWEQKSDFGGTGRMSAAGFSIGNKGYIGTGGGSSECGCDSALTDFWEYDPSTDHWVQKANFGGTGRYGAVGLSIDGKGYIGTGDLDNQQIMTGDFWEYDPSTNSWTEKAQFGGTPRSYASGFSLDDKGYIGIGWDINVNPLQDFWEYNPTANSWNQRAGFGGIARHSGIGFSINNKGYIGTGYGSGSDFWEYTAICYTNATEICNGADDNCDGNIDELFPINTYYADTDNDGYGNLSSATTSCSAPSGYVSDNADCNDINASIHPNSNDICNSIDDNCDGAIDENVITATLSGGTSCADNILTAASSGAVPVNKIVWKRNGVVVNKSWDPNPIAIPFTNAVTTPNDISIDPYDNMLYVADYGNHRILKRSLTDGSESIEVPVTQTQTVFVNLANDIYVADDDGRSVRKYPWGGGGSSIVAGQQYTQGCDPFHLDFAVDAVEDADGYIVTLDRSCNHVERWNTGYGNGGDIIAGIGGYGSGLNQFNDPRALCFDNAGNLYVSDYENHRVIKYAPGATSGVMVAGTGTAGSNRFELNHPRGIAVDDDGDLFICDKDNHRIQEWTAGATEGITIPISGLADPVSIAFDLAGNMYIADFDGNKVIGTSRVTPDHPYAPVFSYAPLLNGSYTVEITDAYGCTAVSVPVVINYIPAWYEDKDSDGYGNAVRSTTQCWQPEGFVADNTDCNDASAYIHPGIADLWCNNIDDNCNGQVDESPLTATINPAGTVNVCDGSSIVLTANGGSGISYQWLKNNNKVIAGETNQTYSAKKTADYKVKETNILGCSSISASTTLIVVATTTASISPLGNLDICVAGAVVLQANNGVGYTYKWMKGANAIDGATNLTYTATKVGTYKVEVTNSGGCSKTSGGTKVTKSCKMHDEDISEFSEFQHEFQLYPNPTNGKFFIELTLPEEVSDATIQVISLLGQIAYSEKAEITDGMLKQELQLNDVVHGIYFVRVIASDQVLSKKIEIVK